MSAVIGLDIGHSAIKIHAVSAKRHISLLVPSLACPAVAISDDGDREKSRAETVVVDGEEWFFGKTALLHGRHIPPGFSDDWIYTAEHTALFLGALKALKGSGLPGLEKPVIVLGLPGRAYDDHRANLASRLGQYAPEGSIYVVPQPAGPYYQHVFDEAGNKFAERKIEEESWAIVEVGHFTTDTAVFNHGTFVNWGLGSCHGVRVAAQELQRLVQANHGLEMDLIEATEALQTKRVANFGQFIGLDAEVDVVSRIIADQVIHHAEQILGGEARKLNGIILAGGGAELVYPKLKKHWPTTIVPHNPRYSVAEGYCRFGLGLMRWMQQKDEKVQKVA